MVILSFAMSEILRYVDSIYDEPVEDALKRWHTLAEIGAGHKPFSMFYVAGQNEAIERVLKRFGFLLGVDRGEMFEFDVKPLQADPIPNLMELEPQVRAVKGSTAVMVANRFERAVAGVTDDYKLSRIGHDWDQNTKEDWRRTEWGRRYSSTGKHTVVLTTVGFSEGPKAYDEAVKSAVGSDFKDGIVEIESV